MVIVCLLRSKNDMLREAESSKGSAALPSSFIINLGLRLTRLKHLLGAVWRVDRVSF